MKQRSKTFISDCPMTGYETETEVKIQYNDPHDMLSIHLRQRWPNGLPHVPRAEEWSRWVTLNVNDGQWDELKKMINEFES